MVEIDRDRSHGESFDRLVGQAREQTAGIAPVIESGEGEPSGRASDPSVDTIPRLRRGSSVGRARD
jgi:hypothetical protein